MIEELKVGKNSLFNSKDYTNPLLSLKTLNLFALLRKVKRVFLSEETKPLIGMSIFNANLV